MAAIKVKTKVTEKGPWAGKGMAATIAQLQGAAEIQVGAFGPEAAKAHPNAKGLTVGELGAIHELGLGTPERSWLRSWFDTHQSEIERRCKEGVQSILKGASRKKVAEDIGFWMAKSMRDNISSGNIRPPISVATAMKKGHDIPLLESAALVNAIIYGIKLPQIKQVRQESVTMAEALRRGK